ncbi:MAG: PAS domain S-box protein [Deltaproteobacteria bacterium]|nr:PAS domain S-box protein [Deltaproteobacteria bacterium]
MGSASYKTKFAVLGAMLVPCFGRLALHGTGYEHDLFRYFVPFFVGGLAGYLIGFLKDKWLVLNNDLKAINEVLKREVNEHKQAEKAQRKSEEKLKSLTNNLNVGVYRNTVGPKGKFIEANPAIVKMFGFDSREEFLKVNVSDLYKYPDDRKEYNAKILKEGAVRNEIIQLQKEDGSSFFGSISAVLVKDEKDEVKYYDGVIEDITKRMKAEKSLQENEKKYRTLIETTDTGYLIVDGAGKVIDANPEYIHLSGHQTIDEIIDRNVVEWTAPHDCKKNAQEVKKCMEKGFVRNLEIDYIDRDGKITPIEINATVVKTEDEHRILALCRDITGRKRAEEALRESEAKYRSMMEAMKDQIYICSPDYRVEYMNPSMIKRIGRDAAEEYCFKALHDLDDKCPWCVQHIIQQNDCCETDIVSPKDNRSYHVTHSPIVHEDGSISKVTVYRDTTDFKKMETQLRQAQKMEAIGTLAGGIAHDFNNILFPMFGYLEMILQDLPEDNPQRRLLVEVFSGAKRARDLVKQILAFSRQKDHDLKPVKPNLIIKEALQLIKSSLPSTIKITQNIQTDCGLIFADPTQIHQIVMNLCTNAYHAMEKTGGKLTAHLKEVELTAEDLKDTAMVPGKHVCLAVVDTGPGMEQKVIDRIFDPYFTTKEQGKGTGLGLAVVDGIVKSHGGRMNVYSEPGKGTEFKVYLPVIKSQKTAKSIEDDLPIQKGKERILLVDDQEHVVDMERKRLERLGYHVTARISSTDALEAFRAQPDKFDVVITDMTMPYMTGDKLAEEMIKIRSDIPIILCTGFSEIMSKEKAAALGIKGFLMKPVMIKELSKIIRDVLDHK